MITVQSHDKSQHHDKLSFFLLDYDDDDNDVKENKEDPGRHVSDRCEPTTEQWKHDKEQLSTC